MFLAWNHGDVAEIWSRIPVGPKSAWSHQVVTVLACHDAMASHRRARVKHLCCFWIFFIVVGSAHGTEDLATDFNVGETCNLDVWDPESFLQIATHLAAQAETQDAPSTHKPKSMKQVEVFSRQKSMTHAMPRILEQLSKYLVAFAYMSFSMVCAGLCLIGLPSKQPQDPRVKEGCSTSWWVFMGFIYALVYFTTDQYVPSLPQMEKDLGGSQSLMSGTVQINLFVKAVFGLLAAGLSDHIGRRPVVLFCIFLLSLASFCCACANQIEWFILARVLQGMGESIEPVVFAMARDHFQDPEERVRIMAALQMIAFMGIAVAPFFGGVCAHFLDWRSTFFALALIWMLVGFCTCANIMECCPDGPRESYLKDVQRIVDTHLICLLLSESFVLGAYFIFNANSSYLAEVNFGQSVLSTSVIMLGFAVVCGLGALCADQIQASVLSRGRWASGLLAISGIMSLVLTAFFPNDFWAYLVGSFVQASMMVTSQVGTATQLCDPQNRYRGSYHPYLRIDSFS